MEKHGSILDYVRSGLDPAVWGQDGHLLPEHQKQITNIISKFLSSVGFKAADSWINDIKIIGSLTTYQYTSASDVDVHIPVNLEAFVKAENPYITEQEANDLLDAIRKKFNPDKTTLSNTNHPLELYFETPINRKTQPVRTGAYSLLQNKWILPPVSIDIDFDIEEINPVLVDAAEEIAAGLDVDLGKLKRDVFRAEELVEVINSWEPEKQEKFKQKLTTRLTEIEQEIQNLILQKDQIADARKKYDPESEQEIKFKYLQRFGYFAIISALKELVKDDGKVTPDELPQIEKILDKEAAKKQQVVPIETMTMGGKTIKIVVGQQELDNYLESINNVVKTEDGEMMFDADSARQAAHDAALESALSLTDFHGEDPYLYAAHVRDAISRFAEEMFDEKYGSLEYQAEFTPSLAMPPNSAGPDNVVIPVDPDPISDEETNVNPIVDKPRNRGGFWRSLIDWFIKNKTEKKARLHTKFWVTPKGELINLWKETHLSWIRANFSDPKIIKYTQPYLVKSESDEYKKFEFDPYAISDKMIADGWVRVSTDDHQAQFDLEVKDLHNLPASVDQIVSQFYVPEFDNSPIAIEDMSRKIVYIEDPTSNIQESVNKALQMKRLVPVAASLKEAYLGNAYWIDPAGKVYAVSKGTTRRLTHKDWIVKNATLLRQKYNLYIEGFDKFSNSSDAEVYEMMRMMYSSGWVRIGDSSSGEEWAVSLYNPKKIPSTVETALMGFVPTGANVYIEEMDLDDGSSQRSVVITWPPEHSLQQAVDKAFRDPSKVNGSKVAAWANPGGDSAYWLDPQGFPYPVDHSHVDWYMANKKLLKDKYNFSLTDQEEQSDDPVDWMIQNDWTRVVAGGKAVGIQIADINNLPSYLEDAIWQFNPKKLYIEDAMGHDVTLDEKELHRGIEKSLQRYRHKIAAFTLQYWIDPNGQEYQSDALKDEGVVPEKLIRQGWVQVLVPSDRQGLLLVVDELEFAPDFLNAFLAKTVGYGDPITVKDIKGSTVTLRYPFKNIRGLIKKQLYAPEQEVAAKIASYGGTQSYWISPDGEVHDASPSHADWAFDNADDLAANYGINLIVPETTTDLEDDDLQSMYSEILDTLIEAGWVRVFIHGREMVIQISDFANVPSSANDFFAAEQANYDNIIVSDYTGQTVNLPETQETFHDAVLNELKLSHTKAASLKQAISGELWFDPSGKQYKVSTTHIDWIRDNLDLFKTQYNIKPVFSDQIPKTPDQEINQRRDMLESVFIQMLQSGWARYGSTNKGSEADAYQFVLQVGDLNRIPAYLDDFIVQKWNPNLSNEYGTPGILIDNFDGEDSIVIDNPFPTLQKAIRKTLREWTKAASLLTASASADILKLINETGGASYNLHSGNLAGTNMYAVSTHPERSVILDHTPTEQEIDTYLQQNSDLIGGENSFGAWSNNGKIYLDIVTTIPDKEKAIELGKKHNQIAIFDLKNFVEIPTGGTGEVQSKQASIRGWFDPSGHYYQIKDQPYETHLDWAESNAELLKTKYNINFSKIDDPVASLINSGWVRITNDLGRFGIQVKNLSHIPDFLEDSLLEKAPSATEIIFEDEQGQSAVIEDYSDGLQNAINKDLQMERIVSNNDPVKASGYYGPEDPEGGEKEYYSQETNEDNLGNPNQRFMGRPKGPNRSNQEEVIQMILDKPLSRRHAKMELKAFTQNGFWVAPDGKAFNVREGAHGLITHSYWITSNATMLQKNYGIADAKKRDYFEVAAEMLQKGWARVGDSARNKFAAIGVEVNSIKSIPSGVEDVLATFLQDGDVIIVADLAGNWAEVNYPFKSLQNEVRRALRGQLIDADYTQDQQEDIFVEQHEFNDNDGLATTPHDFTDSSSDYPSPKDLQPVQVFLDKLDKRKTPPIPSYEVSWEISQPKE